MWGDVQNVFLWFMKLQSNVQIKLPTLTLSMEIALAPGQRLGEPVPPWKGTQPSGHSPISS